MICKTMRGSIATSIVVRWRHCLLLWFTRSSMHPHWLNGMDAVLINCTLSNLILVTAASHSFLVVMLLY